MTLMATANIITIASTFGACLLINYALLIRVRRLESVVRGLLLGSVKVGANHYQAVAQKKALPLSISETP